MANNLMREALEKELAEKVSKTYLLTREQMLAILECIIGLDDIVNELIGENKNELHQDGNESN
jgi:hypothetical protein